MPSANASEIAGWVALIYLGLISLGGILMIFFHNWRWEMPKAEVNHGSDEDTFYCEECGRTGKLGLSGVIQWHYARRQFLCYACRHKFDFEEAQISEGCDLDP